MEGMYNDETLNKDRSAQMDIPEYAKSEMEDKRADISVELDFNEYEKQIFDIICAIVEESAQRNDNVIYYDDVCKRIWKYGQDNLIRELFSDANAKMYTLGVIEKLYINGYCKIERGTVAYPVCISFIISRGEEVEKKESGESKQDQLVKDTFIEIIDKIMHELAEGQKPFPTKEKIIEVIKREKFNIKLGNTNIDKFITTIDCADFKEEVINTLAEESEGKLIQMKFPDASTILFTSTHLSNFFNDILFPKIQDYISEDMNIVEKIKVVYAKKNRPVPPIEVVFENQITEASFFWISTFYEIMSEENKRIGEKTVTHKHLMMYQVASMLYHFSLGKREILMKEEEKENQAAADRSEIEGKLIKDYAEPCTIEQIRLYINNITKLEEKYTADDIEESVSRINEPSVKVNRIPDIMTVTVDSTVYYFHKYRFILMFFHQQKKESRRLQYHYIGTWAESPHLIPKSDNKFEADIKENLSKLFYILLQKVIPNIFSYEKPHEELLPDEVTIKNENIFHSDLSDGKKNKEDYNLLMRSIFEKKNIAQMKPLALLLGLKLSEVKKLAFKQRAKIVPFYRIIFSWFFNILDSIFANSAIKRSIREVVAGALKKEDPVKELNGLVDVFKTREKMTPGLLGYLRNKIREAKGQLRDDKREGTKSEKEAAVERDSLRQIEVKKVKDHFVYGGTIEEKLEEYSKRCFVKLGAAKKESEAAVKGAINVHFRKYKGRPIDSISTITNYANAIVNNNSEVFSEINDKEALKKYIELLLLGVFVRKTQKPSGVGG